MIGQGGNQRLTGFDRCRAVEDEGDAVAGAGEGGAGPVAFGMAQQFGLALAQIESMTYLRNQLLRDSDWASMDHSVELRTPLVDAHLLTQLQPLLPRFAEFPGKTLLAHAPARPLPPTLINRPKTGFGIPVQRWLQEAGLSDGPGWQGWMRQIAREWQAR